MIRQPACGPRVNASAAATISATGSAGSSLDQPNIAAISAPQRSSNAPRKRPCSDPSIRLELRFPRAAAQTRIVSPARIWLDSWKSVRSFRGIFCADISGFESDHLSHAVRSLWVVPDLLLPWRPRALSAHLLFLLSQMFQPKPAGRLHVRPSPCLLQGE
jgi:hypothetical protein